MAAGPPPPAPPPPKRTSWIARLSSNFASAASSPASASAPGSGSGSGSASASASASAPSTPRISSSNTAPSSSHPGQQHHLHLTTAAAHPHTTPSSPNTFADNHRADLARRASSNSRRAGTGAPPRRHSHQHIGSSASAQLQHQLLLRPGLHQPPPPPPPPHHSPPFLNLPSHIKPLHDDEVPSPSEVSSCLPSGHHHQQQQFRHHHFEVDAKQQEHSEQQHHKHTHLDDAFFDARSSISSAAPAYSPPHIHHHHHHHQAGAEIEEEEGVSVLSFGSLGPPTELITSGMVAPGRAANLPSSFDVFRAIQHAQTAGGTAPGSAHRDTGTRAGAGAGGGSGSSLSIGAEGIDPGFSPLYNPAHPHFQHFQHHHRHSSPQPQPDDRTPPATMSAAASGNNNNNKTRDFIDSWRVSVEPPPVVPPSSTAVLVPVPVPVRSSSTSSSFAPKTGIAGTATPGSAGPLSGLSASAAATPMDLLLAPLPPKLPSKRLHADGNGNGYSPHEPQHPHPHGAPVLGMSADGAPPKFGTITSATVLSGLTTELTSVSRR